MAKRKKKEAEAATLPHLDLEVVAEEMRMTVQLADLAPSPYQSREISDDEALADLVDSIERDGLLQPVTVRRLGKAQDLKFELIAGHRRVAAFKKLARTEIPAEVLQVDDEGAYRLALAENMKRLNLNPMEEAHAFRTSSDKFDWSQKTLAEAVNRPAAYVKGRLDLLQLPTSLQAAIAGGLSVAKAKLLEPLDQFSHVKGGGPNLVGHALDLAEVVSESAQGENMGPPGSWIENSTLHEVESQAARWFEAYSFEFKKEWDSDICMAAGCLGIGPDGEPVCLKLEHAFSVRVQAASEMLTKSLEEYFGEKGQAEKHHATKELPVYYDVAELEPRPTWDRSGHAVPQPEGFPPLPIPFADRMMYSSTEAGPALWSSLMEKVRGEQKQKCYDCPIWKKGAKQGRVLLVKLVHEYRSGGYAYFTHIGPVCMVAACRTRQYKASMKAAPGSPEAEAEARTPAEKKKIAVNKAVQPYLEEQVTALIDRLSKDPRRVLAMVFLDRYSMGQMPQLDYKTKDSFDHQKVKIRDHDGTPNGLLKTLMQLGDDKLVRVLADHMVLDFDHAEQSTYTGGKSVRTISVNALVATASLLFGEKAGTAIKDGVAQLKKEAGSPDVKALLKKSVKKAPKKAKAKAKRTSKALAAEQTKVDEELAKT